MVVEPSHRSESRWARLLITPADRFSGYHAQAFASRCSSAGWLGLSSNSRGFHQHVAVLGGKQVTGTMRRSQARKYCILLLPLMRGSGNFSLTLMLCHRMRSDCLLICGHILRSALSTFP